MSKSIQIYKSSNIIKENVSPTSYAFAATLAAMFDEIFRILVKGG